MEKEERQLHRVLESRQPAVDALKVLLSVMVGLAFMAIMPIYDEPFGGCQDRRFITLVRGCSLWPDFLIGLGVVLLVASLGPNRRLTHLWGVGVVTAVAVLGGPGAIKAGIHLDLWSQPSNLIFYWRGSGMALVLGGLVGSGLLMIIPHWLRRLKQKAAKRY